MNSINISSDLLLKIKHNIKNKHCSLNTLKISIKLKSTIKFY